MNTKNNELKKLSMVILSVFIVSIIIFKYDALMMVLNYLFQLVYPFLLGAAIAFIFNIPMNVIETKVLEEQLKLKKGKRIIAYLLTLFISIAIFILILLLVIPELTNTFISIFEMLPSSIEEIKEMLVIIFKDYPNIVYDINYFNIDVNEIQTELISFIQRSGFGYLSDGIGMFSKLLSVLLDIFIAYVFSIYLLMQKEVLVRQLFSLLEVCVNKQKLVYITHVYELSIKTFNKFFTGQFLEAIILGVLFFITMTIFSLPYSMLISIVISITALVPIFGAFIGCIIGIFLIVVVDPASALLFLVIFLVLQQLEGNLIYPQVVGNSIGLPSIWVFVAVTLGAAVMGIVGMILFIPITSILYTLLREFIQQRRKSIKKNKS